MYSCKVLLFIVGLSLFGLVAVAQHDIESDSTTEGE